MPGLDEIQQGLNTSIRLILNVSKCIMQWGQGDQGPPDPVAVNPPPETKSPRITVVNPTSNIKSVPNDTVRLGADLLTQVSSNLCLLTF